MLPDQWLVFRDGGRDVGVLVFADHPEQNAWELVYMGVVAEARGRGFGREMVGIGLQSALRSGRDNLVLAVDGRNVFARRIYESFGFCGFDVKSVYVRTGDREAGK